MVAAFANSRLFPSPHDDVDDGDDCLYMRSERRLFPSDKSSKSRRSPPTFCKCSPEFLPGHVSAFGCRYHLSAHANLETGHTSENECMLHENHHDY